MKRLALGFIALVLSVGFSFGADLGHIIPKAVAPVGPPAFTWDGWYIGVNAGVGLQDTRVDRSATGFLSGLVPQANDSRPHGALYGLQGGFKKQWGSVVGGIDVDFDWTNVKASSSSTAAFGRFVNSNTLSQKLTWISTADLLLGVTPFSHALLYVKGGLAFGKITTESSTTLANCVFGCGSGSADKVATGWNLGLGTEVGLTQHWSVKVEGRYYDLGSVGGTYTTTGFLPSNVSYASAYRGYDVRAGINYRF